MSHISGPAPVAGSARQAGVAPGSSSAAAASRDAVPPPPAFAEGSLWAAQVAAVSTRGFVLLVGGQSFDIDGRPPVPEGTPLLVRARTEDGSPVFDVVPTSRPARAAEALRFALGHLLRHALGASPASLAPHPVTAASAADLSGALAQALRERMAEPSPAVAEYLSRGILRIDLPVTTPDGSASWQIEIDPDAGGGRAQQPHATTVALFATVPALGPVEARLRLVGDDLAVHLVLASADAAAHVERERETLRAGLADLGFRAVSVSALASPAQLARDRATDAVPHERPAAGGFLDVRA